MSQECVIDTHSRLFYVTTLLCYMFETRNENEKRKIQKSMTKKAVIQSLMNKKLFLTTSIMFTYGARVNCLLKIMDIILNSEIKPCSGIGRLFTCFTSLSELFMTIIFNTTNF